MTSDLHCADCGSTHIVDGTKASRRSLPQLKRYHAMIRAAFHQWPEKHAQAHGIDSVDDLRKWLQMKCGHREVATSIELAGMNKDTALLIAEASIKAAGAYAVPVIHGDMLVNFRPKSIAHSKMLHTDFCKLSDDVEAIIESVVGVPAEQLLREQAA